MHDTNTNSESNQKDLLYVLVRHFPVRPNFPKEPTFENGLYGKSAYPAL